ncbi:MAG: restriction endonuclease subunit S [Muribaculaceae bacterium]|nr:restriction endonuclease subunit S [Muribaculaceae bacterium]
MAAVIFLMNRKEKLAMIKNDIEWKEFFFTDVFTEIQRGKRLKKADHTDGSTPYVSSTSFNNGIDGFIGNESSVRIFENCLTIANSGSVGSAFFHKYEFVASDHVTKLKRDGLDKYAYLFLIPLVSRLSEKYSFNREINDERIKREKLILPVNKHGEIDFEFMSKFMQRIEQDILRKTLPILKSKLSLT